MENKEDFKELVRSIVVADFPTEILAFEISADELIENLIEDGTIEAPARKKGQINFIEQTMSVLGFIGVLISTYKAVVELKSLKTKARLDELAVQKNWIEAMRESGLPKEQIEKIASAHLEKLSSYLLK